LRIITGAFGGPIGRKYSDISEFLIEVEIHNDEHKFLSLLLDVIFGIWQNWWTRNTNRCSGIAVQTWCRLQQLNKFWSPSKEKSALWVNTGAFGGPIGKKLFRYILYE